VGLRTGSDVMVKSKINVHLITPPDFSVLSYLQKSHISHVFFLVYGFLQEE
jgi:hypothetical protein